MSTTVVGDIEKHPFNEHGLHLSEAFWLKDGNTIDIVFDSEFPVGTTEPVTSGRAFRGGLLLDNVRQYEGYAWFRIADNYKSYSRQKTNDGWQTKLTTSIIADDFSNPFAIVLFNDSGKSTWLQYTIALHP